jgi:microcin C transport system substrate-binding protein
LVKLEKFPIRNLGVMQAFAFNTRRDKFKDWRVRLAFNYAFNFEDMNRTLFYDQYQRINSYFEGTDLAARGIPDGKELEILNEVREFVPPQLFTTEYRNPEGGDARSMRRNLLEAQRLLEEAGWVIRNGKLTNPKTGETMTVEFLFASPTFERVYLSYKPNLERLGIDVTLRYVDSSQYVNRIRSFDFDVITYSWPQSLSPGNEQLDFWGSEAADRDGSRNVIGIKDPVLDRLVQRLIYAENREDLVAATKALDRVLLWNHYVVPQWTLLSQRTARWDRFGRPDPLPAYSFGFPDIWWYDQGRAERTGVRQ